MGNYLVDKFNSSQFVLLPEYMRNNFNFYSNNITSCNYHKQLSHTQYATS